MAQPEQLIGNAQAELAGLPAVPGEARSVPFATALAFDRSDPFVHSRERPRQRIT